MARITWIAASRVAIGLAGLGFATTALADDILPGNQPWKWQDTNRASIAAMIAQKNGSLGAGGSGGGNSCGGSAGKVTATANYTCIILNGSTADIDALQHALGNQTATSSTDVTANGVPDASLSNVLQSLVN